MLLFNRYEYNPQADLIGKGGFSRVYRALDKKLNRKVALKIYKTSEMAEKYSPVAEIQRVIEFDHPNVSRYIDIEEIEKEDAFGEKEKIQVCVMELLDGGNFAQYYQANKDPEVFKKILIDVLNGLSYLHQNGIIHRDIKPGNILIKNTVKGPVAKITDFGISKRSDASFNSSSSALIVSIPYMAPEQLNAQRYGIDEKISCNIDLWSLGVAVYEIIAGEMLFRTHSQESSEQIMTNIMMPDLPAKINTIPQPFRDFVKLCIVKDAKDRVQKPEDLIPVLMREYPDETVLPENNTDTEVPVLLPDDSKEVIALVEEIEIPVTNETPQPELIVPGKEESEIPEEEPAEDTDDVTRILSKDQIPVEEECQEDDATQILPKETVLAFSGEDLEEDMTRIIPKVNTDQLAGDETVLIPKTGLPENKQLQSLPADDETRILPRGNSIVSNSTPQYKEEPPVPEVRKEKPVNLFNRYDYYPVSDLIGKGGFSRVYKAYDKKLNRWVALKIYKTGEFSDRYSPIAEIRRVINLDHPNICRYLDIEEIEKENPFGENEITQICVMELLDSGNLAEYYRKNKNPDTLKGLVRDILTGLSYLHRHGIIHRDIKPANILIKSTLEGPVAKITDFGISKASDNINSNSSSALVVSIPYMAPEQLNIKKYGIEEKVAYNLDLWSLGVTIYEIITGKVLFKNNDQDSSEQIMTNIMSAGIPEKINELPEPFRKIVSLCVIKNATERVQRAEQLLEYLDARPASSSQQGDTNTAGLKNKSLFLDEEEGKYAKPSKKKVAIQPAYSADETVSVAPGKSFLAMHRGKLIIGILLLAAASMLIYFLNKKENNVPAQTIIPATKDTTNPAAKNTVVPPVTPPVVKDTVASPAVTGGSKEIARSTEKAKQQGLKPNNEKPADASKENTNLSNNTKQITIRIITSRACSVKIENQETNYSVPMPKKMLPGGDIDVYLPPGTYNITAVDANDPTNISKGILNVRASYAGKKNSFKIPWK